MMQRAWARGKAWPVAVGALPAAAAQGIAAGYPPPEARRRRGGVVRSENVAVLQRQQP